MKKSLLLILSLLCLTPAMAQQHRQMPATPEEARAMMSQAQEAPAQAPQQKTVLDTVYTYNGEGKVKWYDVYGYNAQGQLERIDQYYTTDSVPTHMMQTLYFTGKNEEGYKRYGYSSDGWYGIGGNYNLLDDNGNILHREVYLWNRNTKAWYANSYTDNTYDDQNRLLSKVINRRYNKTNGRYAQQVHTYFEYAEDGDTLLDYGYTVDTLGNKSDAHRYEKRYDAEGRLVLTMRQEGWSADYATWESGVKDVYEYNAAGINTRWEEYNWDAATNSFTLYMQTVSDDKGQELWWYKNFGTSSFKYETVRDEEAHTVTALSYSWDKSDEQPTEELVLTTKAVSYYDAEGNILRQETYNVWTGGLRESVDYVYKTITIDDTTPVNKISADEGQDIIIRGNKITTEGARRVAVYTLSGQLVSTSAVTEVTPGIYIVRADNRSVKVQVR